jgi:hypothetical protein
MVDMSKRKPSRRNATDKEAETSKGGAVKPSATKLAIGRTDDGSFQLIHPRCAIKRRQDIEEVMQMIEAEETEIARDELRWLLSECHDFVDAHKLLGDIAVADGDLRLARGHYGYAYQLGIQAIDRAGGVASLAYFNEANRAFFEAGRGLVQCLLKIGKRGMARDVATRLQKLDATDPLQLGRAIKG